MKRLIKNIFSILILFMVFCGFAQEPSFYIRSLRSLRIANTPGVLQPILFKEVDVVYNKICQFLNNKITVNSPGMYEVSGFANINPGVIGISSKDSIHMELYLIKNHQKANEMVLGKTDFTFSYGNFDVAEGFYIAPTKTPLQTGDDLSLWVKILPNSTIALNNNEKYHHITKPTGMEQIAGMRIAKLQ